MKDGLGGVQMYKVYTCKLFFIFGAVAAWLAGPMGPSPSSPPKKVPLPGRLAVYVAARVGHTAWAGAARPGIFWISIPIDWRRDQQPSEATYMCCIVRGRIWAPFDLLGCQRIVFPGLSNDPALQVEAGVVTRVPAFVASQLSCRCVSLLLAVKAGSSGNSCRASFPYCAVFCSIGRLRSEPLISTMARMM